MFQHELINLILSKIKQNSDNKQDKLCKRSLSFNERSVFLLLRHIDNFVIRIFPESFIF